MAITRKLVAQDDNDDNQWLKVDHNSRYIQNDMDDWQFLFGVNSALSTSNQVAKLGAQFDAVNMDAVYFTGYLYNTITGAIDTAATCEFKFYKVVNPSWSDVPLFSELGTVLQNQYFYLSKNLSDFPTVDFDGGDSIAVEVVLIRSNVIYREKLYFNHLGIYDNLNRVKREVRFLDVTKKDL